LGKTRATIPTATNMNVNMMKTSLVISVDVFLLVSAPESGTEKPWLKRRKKSMIINPSTKIPDGIATCESFNFGNKFSVSVIYI
jgi:hypothetical protein